MLTLIFITSEKEIEGSLVKEATASLLHLGTALIHSFTYLFVQFQFLPVWAARNRLQQLKSTWKKNEAVQPSWSWLLLPLRHLNGLPCSSSTLLTKLNLFHQFSSLNLFHFSGLKILQGPSCPIIGKSYFYWRTLQLCLPSFALLTRILSCTQPWSKIFSRKSFWSFLKPDIPFPTHVQLICKLRTSYFSLLNMVILSSAYISNQSWLY